MQIPKDFESGESVKDRQQALEVLTFIRKGWKQLNTVEGFAIFRSSRIVKPCQKAWLAVGDSWKPLESAESVKKMFSQVVATTGLALLYNFLQIYLV